MRPASLSAVLALACGLAFAVPHARAAENAPPKPGAGVDRFSAYTGTWEGEGTLRTPGGPSTIHARHETRAIANGFGVAIHETMDSPELGHYEAENLVGQDPGTGRMHLYTVDNFADVHDHAGAWAADGVLRLRHVGTVDGKRYVEDLTMKPEGSDRYVLTLDATLGGKAYESGTITMHRAMTAGR